MNRIEAKARIRKHLKSKGEEVCEVTEPMVMFWWRLLNFAIFGGKLPEPKRIVLKNFHHETLGWCQPFGRKTQRDVAIGMRREYEDRSIFLTVLAHEMVHQYEWFSGKAMSHGKNFYYWEHKVKHAVGLPLNEYVETYT